MTSTSTARLRRVLITGGDGFVGSHLVAHALERGASVVSLDDHSSPANAGVPRPSAPHELLDRRVGSILDLPLVESLVASVDAVFHLAARVGVRRVLEDPLSTLEVNTIGTQNVLEACARRGVPVLYTSSSEVYGHGVRVPFTESDPIVLGASDQSRWSYAVSKLHGELLGFALAAQRGLPFVAVRFFNVVGPGQRGDQGMVLPRFVTAALANQPIIVHGPGTQRRSFIHARDAASALWDLMARRPGAPEVVNVGSQNYVSILELAHRVLAVTESSSHVQLVDPEDHMPAGFVEVNDRWPDVTRLHNRIGERPLVPLDAIIAETAQALRDSPTGT